MQINNESFVHVKTFSFIFFFHFQFSHSQKKKEKKKEKKGKKGKKGKQQDKLFQAAHTQKNQTRQTCQTTLATNLVTLGLHPRSAFVVNLRMLASKGICMLRNGFCRNIRTSPTQKPHFEIRAPTATLKLRNGFTRCPTGILICQITATCTMPCFGHA